jgi:hypothetical protein
MSSTALTKLFVFFAAVGILPCVSAGPEPSPDRSKDKEVQMVQQPVCDPRWYFSIGGGGDFNIGDNTLNEEVTVNGSRAEGSSRFFDSNAVVREHSFDDIYDNGWHAQGEVGYALTQHLELFGTFRYAHADAIGRTPGGPVAVQASPSGPTTFFPTSTDKFGDYDSWGGELGLRLFFVPRQARFRPYIALSGGASYVDDIEISTFADLSNIGGSIDDLVLRTSFFRDSWIGTGSAVLGVDVNLTCRWTLGVNGGVRYQSPLNDNDSDLIRENDSGDRWTVPVTGYVKFRF